MIYSRVDLAVEQLHVALSIFLGNISNVSALTLAGAAEEILATAVKGNNETPALGKKYEIDSVVHKHMFGNCLNWKDFTKKENYARNAAKHMELPGGTHIDIDLEDAVVWMLARSCSNYESLGLPKTELINRFDEWFAKNISGEI